MKIACVQTNPGENTGANLDSTFQMVRTAAGNGAELIVLPEMFSFMGAESERLKAADKVDSGLFAQLSKLAAELKILLVGGSHSEVSPVVGKVFNTCAVFSPDGKLISSYRKIHLFNLRDSEGRPLYCESDIFAEGEKRALWNCESKGERWKCATSICYDLRFPEFYRKSSKSDSSYDVVFVPAAFTHQTGIAHWEILLRARAIENQCYVVACNQTGFHSGGQKRNYGNSMIVDPWGTVVARAGEDVCILEGEISKAKIAEARTRLPALENRKLY